MSTMQKKLPLWHGTLTALVTPMKADGSIDFPALEKLVEAQIDAGIDGLVACGTTGEAATLTQAEWAEVIGCVLKTSRGRVPVMAGAGAQGTQSTIDAVKRAQDLGAQGALVVTPFYNRPTQDGLRRHFEAVADACDLPQMLYNVPSRTACDLKMETAVGLSAHPNIIGIKDATADLGRLDDGLGAAKDGFVFSSGDDNTACAFMLMGGHGVISVASNLVPKTMAAMVRAAMLANLREATAAHRSLVPLLRALGLETNPLPIKTALAIRGALSEHFRLPLCPMQRHFRASLLEAIEATDLH